MIRTPAIYVKKTYLNAIDIYKAPGPPLLSPPTLLAKLAVVSAFQLSDLCVSVQYKAPAVDEYYTTHVPYIGDFCTDVLHKGHTTQNAKIQHEYTASSFLTCAEYHKYNCYNFINYD